MKNDSFEKIYLVLNIVQFLEVVGKIHLRYSNRTEGDLNIQIDVQGLIDKSYSGKDFYDVFTQIRKDIESDGGKKIACNGSLRNFSMSGFSSGWSNGLQGYLLDESTLESKQAYLFQSVEEPFYKELLSFEDQILYQKRFLEDNKDRFIQRNKYLNEEAKRKHEEHGGIKAIKGFPGNEN